MYQRCWPLALFVVLMGFLAQVRAAEPELKAGVRLRLRGARLQGWVAPEVVDWNNDGLNDLVVGHYSGRLAVHLNRGLGKTGFSFEGTDIRREDGFGSGGRPIWAWRFNKANCICPGPGRLSPRVLDWDGDGKKDLVIGDGVGAQIRIWRNIGTDKAPLFSTHHLSYLPPDAGVRPYHETVSPCVADWNGDGRSDLIVGRNRGIYLYLAEKTKGEPSFDFDRARLGSKIRGVFPTERLSPVLVDWDADGKRDLIVGSQGGEVWFARNVGSATKPKFESYARVKAKGKPIDVGSQARIAVADLDGDGLRDLLVGDDKGGVWFFQARQPAPVARSRLATTESNRVMRVELVGTDDVGRTLTYRISKEPKHGKLLGRSPTMIYLPSKDYVGQDSFEFVVVAGKTKSAPATVTIEVKSVATLPRIASQPADSLVAVGETATLRVVASSTTLLTYQWSRDGKPIPRAIGSEYSIRAAKEADSGVYSVEVTSLGGSVSSRSAKLQVKRTPARTANVPVVAIRYKSPAVEPSTPGILTLTRTGNTEQPVTVLLRYRLGHYPVMADIHYVPVPSSIRMKAGQTNVEIPVVPIDDTLTGGKQTLTFQIVPNPAYRIEAKRGSAQMIFLDDECPHVGVRVVDEATPDAKGERIFEFSAEPAPRRDTTITYAVGGSAVAGVDYKPLPGSVTIPAGNTSARVVLEPYKRPGSAKNKTVVLLLPVHRFTFFDFYRYLTAERTRSASVLLAPTEASLASPKDSNPATRPLDPEVKKLRDEIAKFGWIVFTARSGGLDSDFDIFSMRPDGSSLKNLTNTPDFDEFSARVSPGGKRMLYRRLPKGTKFARSDRTQQDVGTKALRTWPASGALVIANADGSEPKQLGKAGDFEWATWGPKGKRFACLEEVKATKPEAKPKANPAYNIVIRDATTAKVIETHRARGILSRAVWSPDGKRICGPANIRPAKTKLGKGLEYALGMGKMVSIDLASGKRIPMAHFPDWSPVWATDSDGDWFQGGTPEILHSSNNYGICPAYYSMLWRSGLEKKPSQLVFGEYQKHVWGGCTSPDDKYAVFVIEAETWPLQGKLAVIRLADAPIARGNSPLFHEVLRDLFPNVKKGPILDLAHVREGFDPQWVRVDKESTDSGE